LGIVTIRRDSGLQINGIVVVILQPILGCRMIPVCAVAIFANVVVNTIAAPKVNVRPIRVVLAPGTVRVRNRRQLSGHETGGDQE
jgi:hypothetical protein